MDGRKISAPQIVVAAGARPTVPDIDGLDSVGYHTSDTVMRLDELPARMGNHRRGIHRRGAGPRLLRLRDGG